LKVFTGIGGGESLNEANRREDEDKDGLGQHVEGRDEMDAWDLGRYYETQYQPYKGANGG